MIRRQPGNDEIADLLERVANLLEAQAANAWRIRAWRGGAATLRTLPESVVGLLEREGVSGLLALPGIGKSISAAIEEYARTGRLTLLDRLEGDTAAEDLLTTVPGIGDELARRLHEELAIETLEELEIAAHDGRLAGVPGFGPRRVEGVRESVGSILRSSGRRRARRARHLATEPDEPPHGDEEHPDVALVLQVDAAYRRGVEEGSLRRIAPRRFNPEGRAWLPVLHGERGGWSFTAMFSNTARAHELGKTRDWVLVWFERTGGEGMCTVVTEHSGPLEGRRVVRGREAECERHYSAGETMQLGLTFDDEREPPPPPGT